MTTIYPDVSEWQNGVDDSFNRDFLMFRAMNENGIEDVKARDNLTWAISRRASGKIKQFGVYVIPAIAPNQGILNTLDLLGIPHDCVIMIDMESWGGQVVGDHSAQINQLASALAGRQNGRTDLVWGYGNLNDMAHIWPGIPSWCGAIEANYGPASIDPPSGIIGWQYCNAVENGTIYPSATPPFGNCDHNVLFVGIPLVAGGTAPGGLGGGTVVTPPPTPGTQEEEEMITFDLAPGTQKTIVLPQGKVNTVRAAFTAGGSANRQVRITAGPGLTGHRNLGPEGAAGIANTVIQAGAVKTYQLNSGDLVLFVANNVDPGPAGTLSVTIYQTP